MPTSMEPVALDVLVHDCTALAPFLVDLEGGRLRGLRSEQEGFSEVVAEILTNQNLVGDVAGITTSDFEAFKQSNHRVAMVDARLPALKKLVEVMEETRALEDDKRDWKNSQPKLIAKTLTPRIQKELKERGQQLDNDAIAALAKDPRGLPVSLASGAAGIDALVSAAPRVENRVPDGSNWDGADDPARATQGDVQQMVQERDPGSTRS